MSPDQFRRDHPDLFYLDAADLGGLEAHLIRLGVLSQGERLVAAAKAGEGNMNCTVRATTDRRSVVVKQSRPWVEKYPQFAAPWDRACREMEFYGLVRSVPGVASRMPRLLAGDPGARVLVLEDLGTGGDHTDIYRGGTIGAADLQVLADYLTCLHAAFAMTEPGPSLPNREMRDINHAHIFRIPLDAENGLELDAVEPGLQVAAARLKGDPAFVAEVARLGRDVYLADGPCLLHGDFFPGSLVRTTGGPRVIDPEFCFFGRPEIDVAVFLAPLLMAGPAAAAPVDFFGRYRSPVASELRLILQLAGVEIMRRVIGYAQLPLPTGSGLRARLLDLARGLVLHPEVHLDLIA